MATDNKTIGRFHLDGLPASPRGVPQIEVTLILMLMVSSKFLQLIKEQVNLTISKLLLDLTNRRK
jgi:molecular chaperone DnaK (HSP70)